LAYTKRVIATFLRSGIVVRIPLLLMTAVIIYPGSPLCHWMRRQKCSTFAS